MASSAGGDGAGAVRGHASRVKLGRWGSWNLNFKFEFEFPQLSLVYFCAIIRKAVLATTHRLERGQPLVFIDDERRNEGHLQWGLASGP